MSVRSIDQRWAALVDGWAPRGEPGVVESITTQLHDLREQWCADARRALEQGTFPDDAVDPDPDDAEFPEPPEGTFDAAGLRELLETLADAGEPELPEELHPDTWLDPDDLGPAAALFVPVAVWTGFTFLGRTADGATPWAQLVPLFLRAAKVLDARDPDPLDLDALDEALEYPFDP